MRPSREQMYMAMARAAATRATCYRLNVGAVVVHDYNVVGIGYNGAPSGEPHCSGQGCEYFTPSGCKVIHAEVNALNRVQNLSRRSCELYVTHSPCGACAKRIVASVRRMGIYFDDPIIEKVYFETAYRIPDPVNDLIAVGIEVYQVLPSGLLVDCRSGELKPS